MKIHGGVPTLKKVNSEELEKFFQEEISKELYLISFKTSFKSSHVSFAPEFVWLFDDSFIQNIKNLASNQEEETN